MGGGDALHPLQGLDAALRLSGLGRLGAEAGDEAFQMGDFALLFLVGGLLQRQPGGTLVLEIGVVAGVQGDAVLVDVGVSRVDGKTVGDLAPDVWEKASWMTPNPGGVGPMTRAMLLSNVVDRAEALAASRS